jgi:hypothetical protein
MEKIGKQELVKLSAAYLLYHRERCCAAAKGLQKEGVSSMTRFTGMWGFFD